MSDAALTTNDVEPLPAPEAGEPEDPISTNDVEPIPEDEQGGAGAEAPAPAHHAQHATKKAH